MAEHRDERPRVLIVDDHPANRLAFGTILEEAGYLVATADSGPEALDLVMRREFDVILLDVRMPFMDGFEVASCLRKRDPTKETPILLMSAYDRTPAQIAKGYEAGATDYLFNPVDGEVLKSKVAAFVKIHLRSKRLRRQVDQLTESIRSLEEAIAQVRPVHVGLQERGRELTRVLASLRQELEEDSPQVPSTRPHPAPLSAPR